MLYFYLKSLKVKDIIFNYELRQILMNTKEILLLTFEKSLKFSQHLVHVFNYELFEKSAFGQTKHPKRNFYIPGQVHAITVDKIYTKNGKNILVLSRSTGLPIKTFESPYEIDNLLIDTHKERIILYKNYNELEMFDEQGSSIVKNRLDVDG